MCRWKHLLLALVEAAQGPVKELMGTYRITKEDCLQALPGHPGQPAGDIRQP